MFPSLEIFGRRETDNLKHSTPLQIQRSKQIETLKIFNHNVVELNRDVNYKVNFSSANQNFSLSILLPPQFPQETPTVTIHPRVRHPWVHPDFQEITECPGLKNFSMHSDLGRIISVIIHEFQSRPPVILPNHSVLPVTSSIKSSPSKQMALSHGSMLLPSSISSNPSKHIKDSSSHQSSSAVDTFPELLSLSSKELKELIDDDEKMQDFIKKLSIFKKIKECKESILKETEDLASENLKQKPEIEKSKASLLEKFEMTGFLLNQFDELMEKHRMLSERFSPSSIRDCLQQKAVETEDQSEEIADEFLDGKIPVEQFLMKYLDVKFLSYHRKAKEEKLSQQLAELQRSYF